MPSSQQIVPLNQAVPPYFLGVDVGGTNIKIGLVDDRGQTFGFTEIETHEPDGPQVAMNRVVEAIHRLVEPHGLSIGQFPRVGLGTPGTMDIASGMLIEPPNLPHWYHFPIRDCLASAIGLPISFVNDANAAAFGEFWIGIGQPHENMVLITLGTGVGGGIIYNGHLLNGANSFGSECGHIVIDFRPDARLCVWGGGRGHLEAYASASGVVARTREALSAGEKSTLLDDDSLTAKKIYLAAENGDPFALKIIDETAHYLGIGITSLVHTIDPGLVVLGGAMNFGGNASIVGRRFLDKIKETFRERTFSNVFTGTTIDFALLGGDAGYLGAAGIARADFYKSAKVDVG